MDSDKSTKVPSMTSSSPEETRYLAQRNCRERDSLAATRT